MQWALQRKAVDRFSVPDLALWRAMSATRGTLAGLS